MGVVLGVASLVVVLAVTSGFEREFQDKVLALNAHLIVIPYGDVDIDVTRGRPTSRQASRGMPGVVRMAKFLFSAGEVMVGRIGANLKGIDLQQGADDLRRALDRGQRRGAREAGQLPAAAATPRKATDDVGRIILGAELGAPHSRGVGDCVPIMIPFSSGAARRRRRICSGSSACSAWASTSTTRAWRTSASPTRTDWRARAARCSASSCASPTR